MAHGHTAPRRPAPRTRDVSDTPVPVITGAACLICGRRFEPGEDRVPVPSSRLAGAHRHPTCTADDTGPAAPRAR